MTAALRRLCAFAMAVVAGAVLFVTAPSGAQAAPADPTPAEDGPALLSEVLTATGKRYAQAKAALDKSRNRQLQLSLELRQAEDRLEELAPQIGELAAASYRTGKLTAVSALLNTASRDEFMARATVLTELNMVNDRKVAELTAAREKAARAKAALDAEVAEERKQLAVIARQKSEADKALALVGGTKLTGGFVAATSPVAKAAPRNSDGSWPDESCSINDPTTSGCITPRTLNAYNEARKAGFRRFVGCYRPGGPFEHPKGRACDWSLLNSGFANARTDDQRLYGNNLTAFLVRNAERLGILYVIWYRQIWFPVTGWSTYTGPQDHKDHVHMSMV
ncbi:coiled-coil domain-containing protein [Phytohabitans kaempferiae]|uniref:Coiled-coil domain-containing protein n=1 Tax=Phytohabitans kaempferiae TaxID=1620943 RepID=A0ABV6LUK2_9ACTN